MLKPNKAKVPLGQQRISAEFTPGQLVTAITVLLALSVVFLGLGIVIDRYWNYWAGRNTPTTVAAVPQANTPNMATLEAAVPLPDKAVAPPASKQPAQPPRKETRSSEHAAPAPPARSAPAKSQPIPPAPTAPVQPQLEPKEKSDREALAKIPDPGAPTVTQTPQTKPATDKTAVAAPAISEQKSAPATAAAAPQKSTGTWGIQVAAFTGKNREKMAETAQKRLLSNANIKADLVFKQNVVRLVVGNFADKSSAQKECEQMRKKPGFSECFVQLR